MAAELNFDFVLAGRLAVGGGIWSAEAMAEVARLGFTHIINLQTEFDDRALAAAHGIEVLWNPVDDDLEPKSPQFFERSVEFALRALAMPRACMYVHCAAGVHRGPITAAAILCGLGHDPQAALSLVEARRPWAKFPEVYVTSLERWWENRQERC